MHSEANYLDITLLGKEYRVACRPEEHEELLAAVTYVDEKMRDIADKTKSTIAERVAVMAALTIAHEVLARRRQTGETADGQAEIPGEQRGQIDSEMGGKTGYNPGLDFGAVKRRISVMEAQLDAALAAQDTQLF